MAEENAVSDETLSPRAYFERSCAAGNLVFQRDAATGRAVFPPRVVAPVSGATLAWEVSAGSGTVHATTTVHSRSGDAYNIALIDLDEGFRMMARVDEIAPHDVRIGLRVRLRMQGDGDDVFPAFVPSGEVR